MRFRPALDIGSFKRENRQSFPDRPFRPVSDYLFYGYEYYKKSYQEAVDKKAAARLNVQLAWTKEYIEKVTAAIWQARKSRATPESKKEYAHIVLTYICAVVKAYYRQADKNVEITANYMKVYPLGDDRVPDPRFVDPETPTHDRILVVEDSSSDFDEAFPLLPVERENKLKSLPGAPLALLTAGDQLENDTRDIEFQEKLNSKVKKACKDFFKDKRYRSFASIVLRDPRTKEPYGVLNVESNHPNVFGGDDDAQQETKNVIRPFSIVLETITTS